MISDLLIFLVTLALIVCGVGMVLIWWTAWVDIWHYKHMPDDEEEKP